ncbi:MAG: SDR family oxidoreductase [Ruminococcus sp.]|nr:SDR family oxidoreductase [Ruminococcus sp.]
MIFHRAQDYSNNRPDRRDVLSRRARDYCGIPSDTENIELVAGDITKPNLGLSPDDYGRLCETVETVFHCAVPVFYTLLRYRKGYKQGYNYQAQY